MWAQFSATVWLVALLPAFKLKVIYNHKTWQRRFDWATQLCPIKAGRLQQIQQKANQILCLRCCYCLKTKTGMRTVWLEDSFMYLSVLLVRDLISKTVLKRAGPLSEVLLQWIHSSIKRSLTQTVTLFYLCMQVLRFYVAKTSVTATLTQKQSKRAFAPNWIAHKSEVSPPLSRAHCSQRHGVIYARRRWMWGAKRAQGQSDTARSEASLRPEAPCLESYKQYPSYLPARHFLM